MSFLEGRTPVSQILKNITLHHIDGDPDPKEQVKEYIVGEIKQSFWDKIKEWVAEELGLSKTLKKVNTVGAVVDVIDKYQDIVAPIVNKTFFCEASAEEIQDATEVLQIQQGVENIITRIINAVTGNSEPAYGSKAYYDKYGY